MRDFLPFARPSITATERQAVMDVLDSGWLTTGPRTHEFEERFAAYTGTRHAVALNSATAALHLALEALTIGPGDEVIIPTWTFAATGEVVAYRAAKPILVDSEPETLNAAPESILGAVTSRTRAVIAVHLGGLPHRLVELAAALAERGIPLIEDAAHAFPSRIGSCDGRLAGTLGRVGAYSFYATKTMTTGEGGMLVTDDARLADRARMMSLHGVSKDAWKRYTSAGSWYYEILEAGYKYNMTDIAAALGMAQLSRADDLLNERRRLAEQYRTMLAASAVTDLLELPPDAADGSHAWHLFILRLRLDRLTLDRAQVIERLREQGIGTSVHFIPLHLHPYYRRMHGTHPDHYPIATREYERVISLPLWPGMAATGVERVVASLIDVLGPARR